MTQAQASSDIRNQKMLRDQSSNMGEVLLSQAQPLERDQQYKVDFMDLQREVFTMEDYYDAVIKFDGTNSVRDANIIYDFILKLMGTVMAGFVGLAIQTSMVDVNLEDQHVKYDGFNEVPITTEVVLLNGQSGNQGISLNKEGGE
jgi:hypothetical protein